MPGVRLLQRSAQRRQHRRYRAGRPVVTVLGGGPALLLAGSGTLLVTLGALPALRRTR